jgi:hypothetical protein
VKLTRADCAIGISVLALGLSAWQLWDSHKLGQLANDATVVLDVDTEPVRTRLGIFVRNGGPGIAHIKTVRYYVDGKLVPDVADAFEQATKIDSNRLDEIDLSNDVLSPGERQPILRFNARKSEQERAEDFLENHLNVAVAYFSAGGRPDTACADTKTCAQIVGNKQ